MRERNFWLQSTPTQCRCLCKVSRTFIKKKKKKKKKIGAEHIIHHDYRVAWYKNNNNKLENLLNNFYRFFRSGDNLGESSITNQSSGSNIFFQDF